MKITRRLRAVKESGEVVIDVTVVELGITVPVHFNIREFIGWKLENPDKTFLDFFKGKLKPLIRIWKLAKEELAKLPEEIVVEE